MCTSLPLYTEYQWLTVMLILAVTGLMRLPYVIYLKVFILLCSVFFLIYIGKFFQNLYWKSSDMVYIKRAETFENL